MSAWDWTYEGFVPHEEGRREALCTLGNGYFATRGAAPESRAGDVHYPGTYVAGLFNRLETEVQGRVLENESMVNVPNWLPLTFRADGGEWLSEAGLLDHCQELDLRRGVLTRRTRVRDGEGRITSVVQRRFVHLGEPHLAALDTVIVPENWSGRLEVEAGIDAGVENAGVERYRKLASRHLRLLQAREVDAETVLVEVETTQSYVHVAQAARTRVTVDGEPSELVASEFVQDAGFAGRRLAVEVGEGQEVEVEKVVTLYTGRDRAISAPAFDAVTWVRRAAGFDELLAQHVLAWDHLWSHFELETAGGDETLAVLRLHLFHTLQTVSPNTEGLDVGVPARGLHGEAYRGHILWDELFVFPILNLRLPQLTRSLLGYRYRRLDEARHAAARADYRGAMFPWQSGSSGREENQVWHLNPRSGRWVRDVTHRQRHGGLAIAYNAWQYYEATADVSYLVDEGAELILEIARFFDSLAQYDRARDRYVIRGVMGPDEFHTGYPDRDEPGIDNNAYTNVMVVWLLRRAHELFDVLPPWRCTELVEQLGVTREERERWGDVTRKMFVPFHDGVISQFEGFHDLEEFDWRGYRDRYDDIHRLDRILEAEGDTVNRYQASKQADVLMLFYLLSSGELRELLEGVGYELESETIPRTVEYYLARTAHGSTLSSVVHSWVLNRLHREEAWTFFTTALAADVHDIQGGTTAEGVHLAAMAGSVDIVQRAFAGIETRGGLLRFDPRWPEKLGELTLDLLYREHRLTVALDHERLRVATAAGDEPPIRVALRDEVVEMGPGETITFSLG